jgi:hypothetical protein
VCTYFQPTDWNTLFLKGSPAKKKEGKNEMSVVFRTMRGRFTCVSQREPNPALFFFSYLVSMPAPDKGFPAKQNKRVTLVQ